MGDDTDNPESDGGDRPASWRLENELRDSLARLNSRMAAAESVRDKMAADLKSVKQVVGLLPANSLAPQARTYQVRTLVTVAASIAAGVAFDKLVALLATLAAHVGN